MNILPNTVQGINRSATGIINALPPTVDMATAKLNRGIIGTTTRIYSPKGITPKGAMILTNGTAFGPGVPYARTHEAIAFTNFTEIRCIENWVDSEDLPQIQTAARSHSDSTLVRFAGAPPFSGATIIGMNNPVAGPGYMEMDTMVDTTVEEDRWVTVVFFGGDEVVNFLPWSASLGTGTSAIPVTGWGFEADMSFFGTIDESTALADVNDTTLHGFLDSKWSAGFAINDVGNPQGCDSCAADDNDTNPVEATLQISDSVCLAPTTRAGAIAYTVTASNWVDGGVSLTPSASAGNAIVIGAAVKFSDDYLVKAVTTTFPATGDYSLTGTGVFPELAMLTSMSGVTLYDTATQGSEMGKSRCMLNKDTIVSHTLNYVSGQDSFDVAGEADIRFRLQITEASDVGSTQVYKVTSTAHNVTADSINFTLDNSAVAIGRGVIFGT